MPMAYEPIPESYKQAFHQIFDNLTEEEKEWMKNNDSACVHTIFPFGELPPESFNVHGMSIRNAWNLWGMQEGVSTKLREEFINVWTLGHADDMSGFLLDDVWAAVCGVEFDAAAEIERYHKHWKNYGIDPVTQEEIVKTPKKNCWDPRTWRISL